MPSSTTTSTECALQRFLRQKEFYHRSYPLLLHVAEVCLCMPVSNAWHERGASALKAPKNMLKAFTEGRDVQKSPSHFH